MESFSEVVNLDRMAERRDAHSALVELRSEVESVAGFVGAPMIVLVTGAESFW